MNEPQTPAVAPPPSADPLASRLQNLIGLRPGAISALRLRHAAREIAGLAGVTPDRIPALLALDPRYRQELVDRVTVQESQFFRDTPFIDGLTRVVLPSLRDPVTVWSAGCACGQEAFSVGMLLTESGRTDWRILGTDVSSRALRIARGGRYREHELRGLSPERRRRFTRVEGDAEFVIAAPVRDRIEFIAHNLVGAMLPAAAADAQLVLLRNVLIYFDEPSARAVLERLAALLRPGAWILLGGSEVLHPVPGLSLVRAGSVYAYRVGASARTPASAPSAAPRRFAPAAGSASADDLSRSRSGDAARRRDLLADGERHAATGAHLEAIHCFRRLVALDGGDVTARLRLALSLEAAGDAEGAGRAFRSTLATLAGGASGERGNTVDGYRIGDVIALVHERLNALGAPR